MATAQAVQEVQAAIDIGCSGGVVFNASPPPLPENVALSKKVVSLAAPHGVLVMGQVGLLESEQRQDAGEAAVGDTTPPLEAKY